jgi:hypothetical protein
MIEVYSYEPSEVSENMNSQLESWSQLWYEDLEEAGVYSLIVAWDGDDVIGFQTINDCNECVAIEVKDSHLGQGISRLLIEESGCSKPERNENPEFWEAVAGW